MDSKNFALPLWRFKKDADAKKVEQRFLCDALEWGLGDLPPVTELPDFWQDLASGKCIFQRIPKLRPIETFRLIPRNPGQLSSGAKSMAFFLFRPWQELCNDPVALKDADRRNEGNNKIIDILSDGSLILQQLHPLYRNWIKHINMVSYIDLDDFIKIICENYENLGEYIEKSDLFLYLFAYTSGGKNYIDVNEVVKLYKKTAMREILETLEKTLIPNFPLKYICQHVEITWDNAPCGNSLDHPTPLTTLLEADTKRLHLPSLSTAQAHDKGRGLWDAWWPEGESTDKRWYVAAQLEESCVARDPWRDVQEDGVVCIDFGTSSTVAAVREADNSVRLLRLDVSGAEGAEGPDPYENPTALEFANLVETLLPWRNEPWRPLVEWKHVKCSHLARNELRQGQRAESGLQAIKTWARALPESSPVWLRDETGKDFSLSPLPVEEGADSAGPGDFAARPLDPIELYAYFLGIACNNQAFFGGRIYRDYTMTFPVKFPLEVRERILQGFRRGLVRSMPCSLASSRRWQQEKQPFRLRERASEPTAFAASVLPWLGIAPTEGGVPFAVFDFGGGTTDFAFGLWRLPTPEERATEPWEQVLDILDVAGDENLGGEHLLELLAFELLRGNAENRAACVGAGVTFMLPRGEALFDGSELLFTASREARANTVTLCELLRPLWEEGKLPDEGTGLLQANFLDREGATASIALKVNEDALRETLKKRILKGVRAFFAAFCQAFKAHGIRPQELHVLLAGNSCRSTLVQAAFETCLAEIVPHERDSVIIHDEMLPGRAKDAARAGAGRVAADGSIPPTLKTGVALGLLRLLPGEGTGMVERNRAEESPFLHTVGTFSNNVLQPVLPRNAEYGQWHVAGRVFREGVFLLGSTLAPEAIEQQCPRSACRQLRLEWGEENFGKYLFIRAVAPGRIEVALGTDAGAEPYEAGSRILTLEG